MWSQSFRPDELNHNGKLITSFVTPAGKSLQLKTAIPVTGTDSFPENLLSHEVTDLEMTQIKSLIGYMSRNNFANETNFDFNNTLHVMAISIIFEKRISNYQTYTPNYSLYKHHEVVHGYNKFCASKMLTIFCGCICYVLDDLGDNASIVLLENYDSNFPIFSLLNVSKNNIKCIPPISGFIDFVKNVLDIAKTKYCI